MKSTTFSKIQTSLSLIVFTLAAALATSAPAHAQTFSVLYGFLGYPTDGGNSYGDLIQDSDGNLYGTTYYGGSDDHGTIFKIDPSGTRTILYTFLHSDIAAGAFPQGGLFRDPEGNLYGTTFAGGNSNCNCGTIFKLDTSNNLTTLHQFNSYTSGRYPESRLLDVKGTLYGTTAGGGGACSSANGGCGVVFSLNSAGRYAVVHEFTGTADGSQPGDLIRDSAGNLYGAAELDGPDGFGTVFEIDTSGTFAILHTFTGGSDGGYPQGRLLRDVNGNIHGVAGTAADRLDQGEVFHLDASGTLSVLRTFTNPAKGLHPLSLLDVGGVLYGATYGGGDTNCDVSGIGNEGCGVLFQIGKTGEYSVVHTFEMTDGEQPTGALTLGIDGIVYGVTLKGGATCPSADRLGTCGVVFQYKP
jgi:uncharacterized repeat protein (TIGR03803 family)